MDVLRTHGIAELRPLVPTDYGHLYELENSGENLVTYRNRGVTYSPESYAERLWSGVLCQFVFAYDGSLVVSSRHTALILLVVIVTLQQSVSRDGLARGSSLTLVNSSSNICSTTFH